MIGESFGSYRVLSKLGQGGMGVVYLAEHPLLGKKAVVKQLLPELSQNQEIVQRFFNEARAATLIRHPGIVDVFDFGYHASGSAFITMEFLPGESLAARLERERALPPAVAVALTRQIAGAVGAAHAGGIVHRDLKPDNVYLVPERDAPDGVRVKVLDFGIAKLAGIAERGGLKTRTGSVMGTPTYMSPEQCHGAAELDHRADVYSLGCILFEMICGRPPFVGEGLGEILGAHMYQAPPSPRLLVPSCPPSLEGIILATLAKTPTERTPSMEVLIQQLDQLGGAGYPAPLYAPAPVAGATAVMDPAAISRHPVTTLGGAAAQVAPTAVTRPGSGRRGLWLGLGAVTVAAIVVAAVVAGGGGDGSSAPAAGGTATTAGDGGASGAAARCDADATDGCASIARGLLRGPAGDARTAVSKLELGCQAGDASACGLLSRLWITGAEGVPVAASRALSLATTHCAAKQPDACVALATARRDGIGTAADRGGALEAALLACDAGEGRGCAIALPMLAMAEDVAQAEAVGVRALPMLDATCAARELDACVFQAMLLMRGLGPARDLKRATALLQAACDQQHADACVRLARMFDRGQGVRPDLARGRELVRSAAPGLTSRCDADVANACTALAAGLGAETSVSRDAVRIADLLDKGCTGGDGAACVAGAGMHLVGDGVPRDRALAGERYRRGVMLLERQCTMGETTACLRASQVLARGQGVQKNLTRAAELATDACRAGSIDGCVTWGALDPRNAAGAFRRALEMATAACDGGDLSACDVAGDVLALGPAEIADLARGADRYRTACDGGLAEGCFDLAWVLDEGATGKADPDEARRLYRVACEGGHGPACNNLGMFAVKGKHLTGAAAEFERGCDHADAESCVALAELVDGTKLGARDAARARDLRARACVLGLPSACE